MSSEERKRSEVMARLKKGSLRLKDAAEMLGISYRHTRRVWKRFQRQGANGLVHGGVGRKSNRAKPKKLRDRVLQLIRQKYAGEVGERFGPTLAAEHLAALTRISYLYPIRVRRRSSVKLRFYSKACLLAFL
jgi:transposase